MRSIRTYQTRRGQALFSQESTKNRLPNKKLTGCFFCDREMLWKWKLPQQVCFERNGVRVFGPVTKWASFWKRRFSRIFCSASIMFSSLKAWLCVHAFNSCKKNIPDKKRTGAILIIPAGSCSQFLFRNLVNSHVFLLGCLSSDKVWPTCTHHTMLLWSSGREQEAG